MHPQFHVLLIVMRARRGDAILVVVQEVQLYKLYFVCVWKIQPSDLLNYDIVPSCRYITAKDTDSETDGKLAGCTQLRQL